MQYPHGIPRKLSLFATMYVVAGIAGCGNSCFLGFSNNGNGGIIIKAGNPPPACTLNQAQGMVRVRLAKIAACANCAPAISVQHIYLALKGVQIHAATTSEDESAGWIELLPKLNAQPQQIDLMSDSDTELLLANSPAPADIYSFLRLEFSGANSVNPECRGLANCLVMVDGHIEPIDFADKPEVLLRAAPENGALVVLPESTSELQIRLMFRVGSFNDAQCGRTSVTGEFGAVHKAPTD
ncbi:MAG TPA: DUF4382 domain-containing protein [Dongiaceae bacterium]|nr:DUF4382 domain-containing protein [Dongiaceae bacterium]